MSRFPGSTDDERTADGVRTVMQFAVRCALPTMLLLPGCSASGQGVDDPLSRRIAQAKPGEVISVKVGDYGRVTLKNLNFPKSIRVNATGSTFAGIVIWGSTGIEWVGGTVSNSADKSYGVHIRESRDITVKGLTVMNATRGMVIDRGEGINIIGNTLTKLRSDGIDVALSHRVLVDGNSCRDFSPNPAVYDASGRLIRDGDHPDCIQAWSRPTAPATSDVTVTNNSAEGRMQGIFFGNHIRDGVDDGGFDRVVIRNNRINVGFGNGIVIGNSRGGVVRDNIVDTTPGAMLPNKPIRVKAVIRVQGTDNLVCGNKVSAVPAGFGTERCPDKR